MARVYTELRRRIMEGDLRPGTRLDPTKLGKEMLASMTPIREALHQLRGEGLVESWQHEGFWIADLSEIVIRDRYEWCRDLVHLCIQSSYGAPPQVIVRAGSDYPETVSYVLLQIAALSINQERWRAMVSICDRMMLIRKTECRLLDQPFDDVDPLLEAVKAYDWRHVLAGFEAFHKRRMDIASQIAAALRAR